MHHYATALYNNYVHTHTYTILMYVKKYSKTYLLEAEDYTMREGSLIFSPEDTFKTVAVPIRDDRLLEYQERFFLGLSVPNTESGVVLAEPRRVEITITNDDSESQ